MAVRIIRRTEVCDLTGLSNSSIVRLERRGEFPARRRLGPNAVGYLLTEVEAWIASRPAAEESPTPQRLAEGTAGA